MGQREEKLKAFARKFLGPARRVSRKDRLHSRAWQCSSCGRTVEHANPISAPAPCPRCGGIAFETVDPRLQ